MEVNFSAFLEEPKKDPGQLIADWRHNADIAKDFFVSVNLQQFIQEHPNEYFYLIRDTLIATAFFMDEPLKCQLDKVGLQPYVTRWFIHLEAILKELDVIENSGEVTLPRAQSLLLIKRHIDSNLLTELQFAFDYIATVNKNEQSPILKDLVHRIYRRRHPQTKQFRPSLVEHEQVIIDLILFLEKKTGQPAAFVEKYLKQLSGGNTKKVFLQSIVESDEVHKRTNKFYRRFFYLFKLINPNVYFRAENELVRKEDYISMGYLVYQARMVKWLIR